MILTRISFEDLIGIPYLKCGSDTGQWNDCLWSVRMACERIFPDFNPLELPITTQEIEAAIATGGGFGDRWARVNWCDKLGDIVRGTAADEPFIAIMIDPVGRGMLTSNTARGSHRRPFRSLMGIESIWRRGPAR